MRKSWHPSIRSFRPSLWLYVSSHPLERKFFRNHCWLGELRCCRYFILGCVYCIFHKNVLIFCIGCESRRIQGCSWRSQVVRKREEGPTSEKGKEAEKTERTTAGEEAKGSEAKGRRRAERCKNGFVLTCIYIKQKKSAWERTRGKNQRKLYV